MRKQEQDLENKKFSRKFLKKHFEKKDKQTGDCYARQSKVKGKAICESKSDYQRTVHMVKLIRAQGGCLGTKSR